MARSQSRPRRGVPRASIATTMADVASAIHCARTKGERALLHDDHVRPAVGGVDHRVAAIRAEAARPHDGDSHVVGTDLRHLHARQLSRGSPSLPVSRALSCRRPTSRPSAACSPASPLSRRRRHAMRRSARWPSRAPSRAAAGAPSRRATRATAAVCVGSLAADDHRRPFHLVDVGKRHVPESVRQELAHEAARRVVQLELPLAALLARPEKALPVGQPPRHGGIDVDPRGVVLGNERRRLAGGRVHREELALVLETVHHVEQRRSALRPGGVRDVREPRPIPLASTSSRRRSKARCRSARRRSAVRGAGRRCAAGAAPGGRDRRS